MSEEQINGAAPITDEIRAKIEKFKTLTAKNEKLHGQIARYGGTPDTASVIGVRVNMLLDLMLGPSFDGEGPFTEARLDFEIAFHEFFQEALDNMLKEARQRATSGGGTSWTHHPWPTLNPRY